MPASDAIRRRAKPITIIRTSIGGYVDGIWQDGADTEIEITAAIQSLNFRGTTGEERILSPEGLRDSGKWRVWSLSELMTNDRLVINGTNCVLLTAEKWTDHWRAVAGDADAST